MKIVLCCLLLASLFYLSKTAHISKIELQAVQGGFYRTPSGSDRFTDYGQVMCCSFPVNEIDP